MRDVRLASLHTRAVQSPMVTPLRSYPWIGRMLTVSLCDGIGSVWVCLRNLAISTFGLSVEQDHNLSSLVHFHWPQIL